MIDSIKELSYNNYTMNNQQIKIDSSDKGVNTIQFDIQEILNQMEQYTYTEQDKNEVSSNLVENIKSRLNIAEEDVYELYKQGVDLEKLSVNELTYRSKAKGIEDAQCQEDEENQDKSLEEKIEVIKKQNDHMYLYALTSKTTITVNSLYESNFKGEFKKGISQYTKEDVNNVLGMNGLEQNNGNAWAANLLMMYDMGVSSQSVNKLQSMQSAITALDMQQSGSLSGEDELIKDGEVQYQPEYVERITDDLGMVTDEHIEKLIEEGKEININELRESIHKNVSETLREEQHHTPSESNQAELKAVQVVDGEEIPLTNQVEEVKKQIDQIRTKLTIEAAQKISAQMPLESSQLAEVADALLQIERDRTVDVLKEVSLPVTDQNIIAVTEVMNVIDDMKAHFIETAQIELNTDETASLQEIQGALQAYSENETPVELRFGENITKVESQIKDLLQSQRIEETQVNIEAAKALIANQMEVTEENLQNIQEIVIKLNTFLEEMTPLQAAGLIKEGINPYKSSVNELLSTMSKSKVEGLKNSVAETIVAMEESDQISEEQKEGMIGLYRILQAVSQKKEEVIGYLFKNELPLTVENLQLATKYAMGKNHIEAVIDDEFGETESLTYGKETAKQLLERSSGEVSKTLESIKVLENMSLPITEDNVSKVSKMSALLYPYIKEQFKKDLGKFDGMGTLPESFLAKLESVQNVEPELISSMLEQKIPLTLSNIYWMDKITNEPNIYGELLDDKGLLKEGLPSNLEELEKELSELEVSANKQKEEATLNGNISDYRSYKQIEEAVHFQRERIEKEGLYQIPFIIDGERKLINLYLHKDETTGSQEDQSHLKAIITYETKNLGTVKAYLEIKGENIGYKLETESTSRMQVLQTQSEQLLNKLMTIGYNVQYSEFVGDEKAKLVQATNDNSSKNKHKESNFEEIV